MAGVRSGSFNTTSAEGRMLQFVWLVEKTDIKNNYTEISWILQGAGTSGYVTCGNFKVIINGETVYSSATRLDVWVGTVIASGTKKIYHTNTGAGSFSAYAEAGIYEFAVNCSGNGTFELPAIPRTANITSFSVSTRDETSVLYNFTVDSACDYAWYSTDNGVTWKGLPNTNIVSGLSANTSYGFKLRVRRTDSQLTTDSATYQTSTYNYPYCTSSPDFTIGDALTLELYNPLNREVTIQGFAKSNGAEIFKGTIAGSQITGFNDPNSVNIQYASIPTSTSGAYKVVVSWDNKAMTRDAGNVYKVRGNEYPTINAFDYIDGNSAVVAVTKDNTQIVQNKSMLQARFHSATANYGASGISMYVIECNGITKFWGKEGSYDIGTIDSARNVDLTLTVHDSRGLTASKTITVKMVAYETPKATVDLRRLNNYEDETYLTVDGSVSSVLGKNTMTIQYRYRLESGSYGSFATIGDRVTKTFSLDKNNVYVFNVVVTDIFGSQFNGEYQLFKGVFPLFIDTVKNSVGINCFPQNANSLEVNGKDLYDFVNKYEKSHKQIYLGSAGGLVISVDGINGSDKIPIVVMGADNASGVPVHIIIHWSNSYIGYKNLGYECAVTSNGKYIHINASQYSYYQVSVPMGSEISLANRAL